MSPVISQVFHSSSVGLLMSSNLHPPIIGSSWAVYNHWLSDKGNMFNFHFVWFWTTINYRTTRISKRNQTANSCRSFNNINNYPLPNANPWNMKLKYSYGFVESFIGSNTITITHIHAPVSVRVWIRAFDLIYSLFFSFLNYVNLTNICHWWYCFNPLSFSWKRT